MSVISKFYSSVSEIASGPVINMDQVKASLHEPSTWVAGAAACAATYWLYTVLRDRNLPPGPWRIPLLGNLVQIMRQPKPSYIYFRELADKYGPIMTIYAGPMPTVIINDSQGIQETFIKQPNEFAGRVPTLSALIFSEGGKDIAVGDLGPAWSLHRKLAMTALKHYASLDNLTSLVRESTAEACQLMVERKEAFNPRTTLYLIVYNVLAGICFGKHFSFDDNDFQWLMKVLRETNDEFATGLLGDYLPFLSFLPTPGKRKLTKRMDDILQYMDKFIVDHVKTFDVNNIRDITDAVIKAQKQLEREGVEDMSMFTEVNRRQIVMDIFFAGTDTTMFTVYWLILALMTYPKLQKDIKAEIDREVGRDSVITYKDRVKLPYTQAVIQEVMRYRPIIPLALPHRVTATTHVKGYRIPKDMTVLPNLYSCHFDPKCWTNPEKFDPTRFLDGQGKVVNKKEGFLPFSAGRRQCAGEHVAKADIFLTFTNLMQKVQFLPDPQRTEPYTMDIKVDAGPFLCEPKEDYKIIAEMR